MTTTQNHFTRSISLHAIVADKGYILLHLLTHESWPRNCEISINLTCISTFKNVLFTLLAYIIYPMCTYVTYLKFVISNLQQRKKKKKKRTTTLSQKVLSKLVIWFIIFKNLNLKGSGRVRHYKKKRKKKGGILNEFGGYLVFKQLPKWETKRGKP